MSYNALRNSGQYFRIVYFSNTSSDLWKMIRLREDGKYYYTNESMPTCRKYGTMDARIYVPRSLTSPNNIDIALWHIYEWISSPTNWYTPHIDINWNTRRLELSYEPYHLYGWLWQQFIDEVILFSGQSSCICKWCHHPITGAKHADRQFCNGSHQRNITVQ